MKKIVIIEDSSKFRDLWKEFFKNHPEVEAEIEIPEDFASVEELSKKVFESLLAGSYVIFDNDIRGFTGVPDDRENGSMGGDKYYRPLFEMGFGAMIAMSSSSRVDQAINIPKCGGDGKELVRFLSGKFYKDKTCGGEEYYHL